MLRNAGIPDAEFEIKCMIEQITGNRFAFQICPEHRQQILDMIQRRIKGEPLQYILGEWEFYGLKIFVGKGVLIPRSDTELLIDTLRNRFRNQSADLKILDLCTGSGCIAIALKSCLPDADITAIDISSDALAYAQKNIDYHQMKINLIQADVLNPELADQFRNYDLIVSNPPYLTGQEMSELQPEVRYEPQTALFAENNGLFFYQNITRIWKGSLKSGGMLAYEIGWKQAEQVRNILTAYDFHKIQVMQDIERRDRVVTGQKNSGISQK